MVILSLSLLRRGGGWRHAHGCGIFLLTKGVSRKGCEHDSWYEGVDWERGSVVGLRSDS